MVQLTPATSMITAAWSLQRAQHGEQPFWMAAVLAAMLGQIGLPGGGVGYGYGAIGGVGNPMKLCASCCKAVVVLFFRAKKILGLPR